MPRNRTHLQLVLLLLLASEAGYSVHAQASPAKTSLVSFEKSIQNGKGAGVERELLSFLVKNPNEARGFYLMALLRAQQERPNEARSLLSRAVTLDPGLVAAKLQLAVIAYRLGNDEEARTILKNIDIGPVSAVDRLEFARTLMLLGDARPALEAMDSLPASIKNSSALPVRASAYLKAGDGHKLAELLPAAKRLAQREPAVAIEFAAAIAAGGFHKEAAELLRLVIASSPRNVAALVLLAKQEIQLKDLQRATTAVDRAALLAPDSADVAIARAELEAEKQNWQGSLKLLEQAMGNRPDSVPLLAQMAVTAMRANQPRRAVAAAEKLLILKPDEPEHLYLFGAASLQAGSLSAAEQHLQRFIDARPRDSRGCLALGLTLAAQTGKLEQARQRLSNCLEIDPANSEARYQLGISYKTQGDTAKAIEYLEETVRRMPNYSLALRDLGAVYLQAGEEAKARSALEKAASISPEDADTHFQLSRLYNLTGETARAKQHFEKFQKLRDSN